jgi:hypothetical protein
MYGMFLNKSEQIPVPNNQSLHHFTYREIIANMNHLDRVFKKTVDEKTIPGIDVLRRLHFKYAVVSVRNPFDRIVSEILWRMRGKGLNDTSLIQKEFIEKEIEVFLNTETYPHLDNHRLPQYQFILDESGTPLENIHIIRQETLTEGMLALGFEGFDMFKNKNTIDLNYRSLLTEKAADMIRTYYAEDFAYFGYSTEL